MKLREAVYLKINRTDDYAFKNLSRWIDAAYLIGADCYIVCDDVSLKQSICDKLIMYSKVVIISSEHNQVLNSIVAVIANRNWQNAAYAHLTTFWHAKEKGYDYFWNIDADDTRFCVSIDRMVEILQNVEKYAHSQGIECFSLDMWRSETGGRHWSFGVTYIDGKVEWIELIKTKQNDVRYKEMDTEGNRNVDWFFTYLKENTDRKIETFYVENLRFIHYSNDFVNKPIASGMYHWKDGKLTYPFLYYGYMSKELGQYNIADDAIKIDIGISDEEAWNMIAYYAQEGKDLRIYYDSSKIINTHLANEKFKKYLEKHGIQLDESYEIVCFGAGNALEKNLGKILKVYNLKYVCDNDVEKWGKDVFPGVKCISPIELTKMENVFVIIMVYSKNCVSQIEKQLIDINIKYDFMDNWFICME